MTSVARRRWNVSPRRTCALCDGEFPYLSRRPRGFSLVELLVVIGIVSTLVSLLLPAITSARAQSRSVSCLSNIRQITVALTLYANDNDGRFPPNLSAPSPGQYWSDAEHIGRYLPTVAAASNSVGGGVLVCPSDENAARSYAMNVWACSKIDPFMLSSPDPHGECWTVISKNSSDLILIADAFSWVRSAGTDPVASPSIGFAGLTPGQRFGAAGGIKPPVNAGSWGKVYSELPFYRHRTSGLGKASEPKGRVAIGYADGHAAMKAESELGDAQTGKSTLDSLWSPIDSQINN